MADFNKVILVGRLTRDPILSYTPSQTAVVDVGLAVNRKWRNAADEIKEQVCFVDCKAFAKTAETINKYLSKGRSLLIEGRLAFDSWEDDGGQRHNKLRVVIERFQFMGSNSKTTNGSNNQDDNSPVNDPEDVPF